MKYKNIPDYITKKFSASKYAGIFTDKMKEAGYNPGDYGKKQFEEFYTKYLNAPAYRKIKSENESYHYKFCAALAQLKTNLSMGCSGPRPYNIKKFWELSDNEIDFVFANAPLDIVGFALSSDMDKKDISRAAEIYSRRAGDGASRRLIKQ